MFRLLAEQQAYRFLKVPELVKRKGLAIPIDGHTLSRAY
jgi:hypothetical protein